MCFCFILFTCSRDCPDTMECGGIQRQGQAGEVKPQDCTARRIFRLELLSRGRLRRESISGYLRCIFRIRENSVYVALLTGLIVVTSSRPGHLCVSQWQQNLKHCGTEDNHILFVTLAVIKVRSS